MSKFQDDQKKESMMRILTWRIINTGLVLLCLEIIFAMFMSYIDKKYAVHTHLFITLISIGVSGKGVQKAIEIVENFKKRKNGETTTDTR